jgi:hypothetical protein
MYLTLVFVDGVRTLVKQERDPSSGLENNKVHWIYIDPSSGLENNKVHWIYISGSEHSKRIRMSLLRVSLCF